MRRFILDTNIVLQIIRDNNRFKQIASLLSLDKNDTTILISIVTKAELLALGKKNGWGQKKLSLLKNLLEELIIIDINNSDSTLIDAYSTIDAFSQGSLTDRPLNTTARNMGKNDLWIAATAYVANAELVTMDADFDHLNEEFMTIHKF